MILCCCLDPIQFNNCSYTHEVKYHVVVSYIYYTCLLFIYLFVCLSLLVFMFFLSGTVKMIAHTAMIDLYILESLSESAIHVCRRTEQTWEKESEAPIDDGHQWRKYGQKEILNAKFPRYRYICDHTCMIMCQLSSNTN